ncbi:hypothetical protein, partial [Serratia marcescens]|uniref:hypothetical protein n=1 Tax=Serratia marcescens TaxID=615 RepID=UPI0013DEB8F7
MFVANYSKRNTEMQSINFKISISISWLYLILLSVERQPKAVLTQSENGKFVIFQSPIPSAYSFSPSMPKAAAIARQPPGFHCFFYAGALKSAAPRTPLLSPCTGGNTAAGSMPG